MVKRYKKCFRASFICLVPLLFPEKVNIVLYVLCNIFVIHKKVTILRIFSVKYYHKRFTSQIK